MRILYLAALLAVCAWNAPAHALDEPVAPRIDLFVGGHYALGIGDVCERKDGDAECTGGGGFVGAHALVLLRLIDHVSFGPSLAYGVQPVIYSLGEDSELDVELWRVAAEGRYWLSSRTRLGLYLAAEAGLALMQNNLDPGSLDPEAPDEVSASQAAPLLGAGLGLGIRLPFGLGLVPSVRVFTTFFGEDPPALTSDIDAHSYGTLTFVALYLDATFGFGL